MDYILIVHVLSLLVTIVALGIAYKIYQFNRLSKGWLALVSALVLVVIRRGIVLATSIGYFPAIGAKIVTVDGIIFLVTITLYSFGLWSMYQNFRTFDVIETKTKEKIKVFAGRK